MDKHKTITNRSTSSLDAKNMGMGMFAFPATPPQTHHFTNTSQFSTIITIRIIMIISAQIISTSRIWYTVRPCAQIAFTLGQTSTLESYPQCHDYFTGVSPNLPVIVTADFSSQNSMELSAALGIPFGAAGWLALLIHTFAIECYVSVTPLQKNESERG
jgi:hypothetical protein